MTVVILSRRRSLYSTRRLREEAQALGAEVRIIDPLKCVLSLCDGSPAVLYNGKPVVDVDVVVPRIGTYGTGYSISVVRHFDLIHVPVLNNHGPIARARNKLGCLQLLVQNGIRVPDTLISRYPRRLNKLLELLGGTPIILKLLKGTQGTGVIISESPQSVESVLETIWSLGEDIMLQRLIKESRGTDLRVLVLGGRVVASMKRIARPGEFRSNIHRGGVGVTIELTAQQKKTAIAATRILGLQLAGVDLLMGKTGPLVIEVNASPGFQGLEAATGDNIARKIIRYALSLPRRAR